MRILSLKHELQPIHRLDLQVQPNALQKVKVAVVGLEFSPGESLETPAYFSAEAQPLRQVIVQFVGKKHIVLLSWRLGRLLGRQSQAGSKKNNQDNNSDVRELHGLPSSSRVVSLPTQPWARAR